MRPTNFSAISAVNNTGTVNSLAIGTQFDTTASFQAIFSDPAAAGTLTIQASNDLVVATHWTTIPNATATVVAGATVLITIQNINYRWIRINWVSSAGAGTITVNAFLIGYN